MAWTDRDGKPVEAPEPPAAGSYYTEIGDFQGAAYERNAFALGTEQEAAFLWEALDLRPREVLVDVGCGTGRHTRAFAERGVRAIGLDISQGLLTAAASLTSRTDRVASATERSTCAPWFVRADARAMPLPDGCADVVICLCQGGFGITPGGDADVLAEIARVLRPGGRLALTAFSLAFATRWLAPEDAIDLERGLIHTPADVRGPDGEARRYDLWTSCYTVAELRHLFAGAGFADVRLSGVEPGAYRLDPPRLSDPELLALARRA
jgi:SAM-dependent methyltransferase